MRSIVLIFAFVIGLMVFWAFMSPLFHARKALSTQSPPAQHQPLPADPGSDPPGS
jgi:hypothetical protein